MYEDGLSMLMAEINACHDWLIILSRCRRKHLIQERIIDHTREIWVRRFVYVNPVTFSKRARLGRWSSKIFSDSACGSVIFVKNVCSRCNVRCRHSTNWKMRLFEVTIMKGGARVILGRQLRDLHWPRMETHRCPCTRKKINFTPFHFRHSEWQIYFSSFATCKHVNLKFVDVSSNDLFFSKYYL